MTKRPVELVQLDLATGQVGGIWPIDDLTGSAPCLGPMLVKDNGLWVFFSAAETGGQREMVELMSAEDVAK